MRPYTISNQNKPYFLTWTTVEWIDIFTRQRYRDIVLDSLRYCMNHKGLILYAYVIMSNHMHLIATSRDDYSLSGIIRDCKKFTTKAIVESMQNEPESRASWLEIIIRAHASVNHRNKEYQLWQQKNHAIEVSDLRRFYQKLAYIHMNPVKAGIVAEPEHYLYSSARNYAFQNALLAVTLMEIVPLDGYMGPIE